MNGLGAAILLALSTAAQAYPAHCQRNGGPEYVCHICYRGHNAMTLTEYECTAKEEQRQMKRLLHTRPGAGIPMIEKFRSWLVQGMERVLWGRQRKTPAARRHRIEPCTGNAAQALSIDFSSGRAAPGPGWPPKDLGQAASSLPSQTRGTP